MYTPATTSLPLGEEPLDAVAAARTVTCNTLAHLTNGIDVQSLLADAAPRQLRARHAPTAMA